MSPFRAERRASLGRALAVLVITAGAAWLLRGIAEDVGFRVDLLQQGLSEDAGFDVSLPHEVVDARALLRRHPGDDAPVSLGPGLKDDPLLQQRMWEGLYPRRFHHGETGRTLWQAPGPTRSGCQIIERRGNVVLADCN